MKSLRTMSRHWLFPVVLAVAGAIYFSKGSVLGALANLLHLAMPFFVIYLIFWFFKNVVYKNSNKKSNNEVIVDLCPKCGEQLNKNHVCNKSS